MAISAALLFSLFLQVNVGHAASFTVNSFVDGVDVAPGNGICATPTGVCTLRAAIQETNALPGADTIILPAGTYILTIPGPFEDHAATGDLDITQDLTILGAGAASTIIDGNGAVTGDRVFQVASAPTPITVRISGVTIRGGRIAGTNGGGIHTAGNLTLSDVVVTQNSATNNGGGVRVDEHSLTLINTVVTQNTSGVLEVRPISLEQMFPAGGRLA